MTSNSANTREHQAALVRKAQAGSIEARNQLIEENLGLLYSTIRSMNLPRTDADEHLSVAVDAFIRCINAFDPDRGIALSTYAARSIRLEVYRQHNSDRGPVRVPEIDKRSTPDRRRLAENARVSKRIHPDLPVFAPITEEPPQAEIQGKLWPWIENLPYEHQVAAHCLAMGMSVNQHADVAGIGWDTAKKHRHAAVYALRILAASAA